MKLCKFNLFLGKEFGFGRYYNSASHILQVHKDHSKIIYATEFLTYIATHFVCPILMQLNV